MNMPVNQATSASWIEKNPGVCGGAACIRNTRHTVAGLVQWRRLGLSDERILEHHLDLNRTDLETAWDYYNQQAAEIEQRIREDEDS
jgi:uncharacterized protein (DUF433 family)